MVNIFIWMMMTSGVPSLYPLLISFLFPPLSVFAVKARSEKVFKSLIQVDRMGVGVIGSAVGRIFDIIEYRTVSWLIDYGTLSYPKDHLQAF